MVSIKDIAKECGVSPATVSKALNGYPDISAETAERIRKVAEQLHYRPNAAARQLKTNMSKNIGVVYVDQMESGLTHEYFSQILDSAKSYAEANGYDITFISESIGFGSYLDHVRYRRCDGVLIVCADFETKAVRELVRSEVPTVCIDYVFNDVSSVLSDNSIGEYELTKFLVENGHRRIAFIHGEKTSVTDRRITGYYRALKEAGAEIDDSLVVEGRYHDPSDSALKTVDLISRKDRPTAIIYPDDYSALGGITELDKRGIRIPADISIAGYDGLPLAKVIHPNLTTWHQNAEKIGKESARKLIEIIEDPKGTESELIQISGEIIKGESVKKIET